MYDLSDKTKRRKHLSDWEAILLGNTYNWLTVLSVHENIVGSKKRGYLATCKCKCGSITEVSPSSLVNGKAHSCGCYRLSKEHSIKTHEWQKDKTRTSAVGDKCKAFYKANPDAIVSISNKNKEYWSSHPDIVAERALKHSQFYKDNPDKLKEFSDSVRKNYADNPDRALKLSESMTQYFIDHPNEASERAKKYMGWYNSNPDEVSEMHRKQHLWLSDKDRVAAASNKRLETIKNNPEIQQTIVDKSKKWASDNRNKVIQHAQDLSDLFTERRKATDFSELLDYLHPDYVNKLLEGSIKSTDIVLTRCPVCGNFDKHSLHNIFIFESCSFKYGHLPLCKHCKNTLTSSFYETDIANYISTFYNGTCIRNDRSVLHGKELDLYYPDKKIAIEFNGNYWHSEEFKPNDYHYSKYISCRNNDIILVSIFENMWLNQEVKIKSYLLDLFNGLENDLSFSDDHTCLNNNFPSPNSYACYGYIDDSYSYRGITVYTCGYSKLHR